MSRISRIPRGQRILIILLILIEGLLVCAMLARLSQSIVLTDPGIVAQIPQPIDQAAEPEPQAQTPSDEATPTAAQVLQATNTPKPTATPTNEPTATFTAVATATPKPADGDARNNLASVDSGGDAPPATSTSTPAQLSIKPATSTSTPAQLPIKPATSTSTPAQLPINPTNTPTNTSQPNTPISTPQTADTPTAAAPQEPTPTLIIIPVTGDDSPETFDLASIVLALVGTSMLLLLLGGARKRHRRYPHGLSD